MEIHVLARSVMRAMRLQGPALDMVEDLLRKALVGKWGLTVVEWPNYRLKSSPVKLPRGKYARTAILALREANGPLALPDLVHAYNAKYRHSAICPEFWMWYSLNEKEFCRIFVKNGALLLDLTDTMRCELGGRKTSQRTASLDVQGAIAERLDEKSLETVLANRPDLLEPGLTVFQRQSRIPVGIMDLLCVDQKRNYVVVEIKRPAAGYREVVGQITTYMGWVRKNIATQHQTVRGIIVVGKRNERLDYSLDLIPDISVRTFF